MKLSKIFRPVISFVCCLMIGYCPVHSWYDFSFNSSFCCHLALARQEKRAKIKHFMAFNWLLKQHRSEAANTKNSVLLSTQLWLWPFNLGSRNRWLKNFSFRSIHFSAWLFVFEFICCVYLYRVIIDVSGREIMRERTARITGRKYIVFQLFLLFPKIIITI